MFKHFMMSAAALSFAILTGCASVPMESPEKDQAYKTFPAPPQDQAGLYIFRDSMLGAALKKTVKIDDEVVGEDHRERGVAGHRAPELLAVRGAL